MSLWSTIWMTLASSLGYLLKHYLNERSWNKIRDVAAEIIKDPDKTDNVRQAVLESISKVLDDRIAQEANKVKVVLNGHRPVTGPVVKVDDVSDGK